VQPNITFILTCFREGRLLLSAVDSIRLQSFRYWECILVNDASPDQATNQVCAQIEGFRDPRIRVIWRSVNGGLSAARNTGIEAARTEWVMPIDGDDRLAEGATEAISRGIQTAGDAGFILGGLRTLGLYDQVWHPQEIRRCEILERQVVPGPSPFRKAVWEQVGGYDLALSYGNQDWDFWMHVLRLRIGWLRIPEIIYLYQARAGSMCASYGLRWPWIAEYMVKKHRPFFDECGSAPGFLAQGYRRGAFAALESGATRQAVEWAATAIRYGDRSRAMWSILLRNALKALANRGNTQAATSARD
jgi:glycosyltransferase involved in cell wall biosynthesis